MRTRTKFVAYAPQGMSRPAIQKLQRALIWWKQFAGVPVSKIDAGTVDVFRRNALAAGLSPTSIKWTVSAVLSAGRRSKRGKSGKGAA